MYNIILSMAGLSGNCLEICVSLMISEMLINYILLLYIGQCKCRVIKNIGYHLWKLHLL